MFGITKINNFRGDLSGISAKTATLIRRIWSGEPRCHDSFCMQNELCQILYSQSAWYDDDDEVSFLYHYRVHMDIGNSKNNLGIEVP